MMPPADLAVSCGDMSQVWVRLDGLDAGVEGGLEVVGVDGAFGSDDDKVCARSQFSPWP
jgi:hypothetical protein